MAIELVQYNREITQSIRKAHETGFLTCDHADYLYEMARDSTLASDISEMIRLGSVPDVQFGALFFASYLWASGDGADKKFESDAGRKLATFIFMQQFGVNNSREVLAAIMPFYRQHGAISETGHEQRP